MFGHTSQNESQTLSSFVFLGYIVREIVLEIEALGENCINLLLKVRET